MNNQDLYKVVAFQVAQTKNGKEMWRITMCKDGNEDKPLTGVIWQEDIPRFDGAKLNVGYPKSWDNYNKIVNFY